MCTNILGNFGSYSTAHTGQHGGAFTAPLPCTTNLLPYPLEATVHYKGITMPPLKTFGFLQKGCHKSTTSRLEEL